jgi:hypothetical protein
VGGLTAWVIDHPGRVIGLFVLPSLALACGVYRLRFESNYINIYKSQTRVVRDYHFVEDRFGGIGLVEVMFRGPQRITVEWLKSLDATAQKLAAVDPDVVSQVLSLADVLREETDEDDKQADAPADPARVLETKLRVLGTPAYSHFLKNFWDKSSGTMRILVRIREGADAERKQAAFRALLTAVESDHDLLAPVADNNVGTGATGGASGTLEGAAEITGLSHLMTQVTTAIITTQFESTAWAGAMILLMLVVALRSVWLALLALVPTLLAVGLVLGAMGWLGIKIDLSTALVASVAMGLSVDDTFHCLLRWKRELAGGRIATDALRTAYAGTGPGVIVSSAAVSLGFLAMIFSEFVPTANFGWLVAVATLGGSLGNLVVLPACLAVVNRNRQN